MSSKIATYVAPGLLLAACSSIAVAEDVTIDVVTQAWKQTQEKVRSATFQWETRKWIAKGSQTFIDGVVHPEEDVTLAYNRTLIFKNGKMRYENSGPRWDPTQTKWVDNLELYTWDGISAVFYDGHRETPNAMIHDSNVKIATTKELLPIQMTFRLLEPTWNMFQSRYYEIAPSSDTVNGALCWNIETARALMREKISKGRKPLKAVYTVCPDRNYAVIRYTTMNVATGVPTVEIQIEQAWDEECSVWVPSEWTITHHGVRGTRRMETSVVLNYSLNETVSEEKFALDLPVGTLVSDLRAARNGAPELYILRTGKEKRAITREEKFRDGVTRQELLKTESGMAGLRQSKAGGIFSSPVAFAWMFGIVLVALAAGLALRNQLRT